MKAKTLAITIGIILVVIGIGYVGEICGVWDFEIFFSGWWTLFLIVPAIVSLVKKGPEPIYFILLGIGAVLLLTRQSFVPEILKRMIFPVILILLGFVIVFRSRLGAGDGYIAIFGGRSPKFVGKPFEGAFAVAIFGGVDLKLTEAIIQSGAEISCISLFGGVDVVLPPDVNAEVSGIPVFGGIGEPKNRKWIDGAVTVKITALAIFGGVDVKQPHSL